MPKIAAARVVNGLALVQHSDPAIVELVFVDADGNQQGGAAFGFVGNGTGDIYAIVRNNPGPAFNVQPTNQIFMTNLVCP